MTEQEFFAQRRMFIVVDGTVMLAPPGLTLTHAEWVHGLFVGSPERAEAVMKTCTRGYALGTRVVGYVGDFTHWVNHKHMAAAVRVLLAVYPGLAEVGIGAKYAQTHPWPPRATHEITAYLAHFSTQEAPCSSSPAGS